MYTGKHRWVIILEDDAEFVPGVDLLDFTKVKRSKGVEVFWHGKHKRK